METNIANIKMTIQATLDELLSEHLIPFRLIAHKVDEDGPGRYVVPFYDSRIHSFTFSWPDGEDPFKEVVRTAVLDRVKTMDGSRNGTLA